jgi:Predicted permeases
MLEREFIYLWYYFTIVLDQIAPYWIFGIVIGSVISVFGKARIHRLFASTQGKEIGLLGLVPASLLGILSPLCMYGTIPIAASFSRKGMRQDWLAAFMMSSILLNPQLIIYSAALGRDVLFIRIASGFLCGVLAGALVRYFYKDRPFFNFTGFEESAGRDTDPNLFLRLIKNIWRNIKATGFYFLIGIILTVLFQRYVPTDLFAGLFGKQRGFGVLLAATLGVPLYMCGGGTIPLLMDWLGSGLSVGAAAAFMITGPATKFTNLGAVKIVLGKNRFLIYLLFIMLYALLLGVLLNIFN